MGVEVLERTKARVRGRMTVREDLCTAGGICHGGARAWRGETSKSRPARAAGAEPPQ